MPLPSIYRWPDLGTFWTIPNALSLSRLVLVAPITMLLWTDGSLGWLFGLVMAAILTDWFDGRIARWLDTESEWGKVLDPIADKVGAVATVSALTFRVADPTLPVWFFGALMTRDILILAGSLLIVRRSGRVAASAWAGKAATFWLAVTVLAAVLKADPPVLMFCVWMTTTLLVISFFVYLVRYLNAARRDPPMPNPPSLQGVRPHSLPGDAIPSDKPSNDLASTDSVSDATATPQTDPYPGTPSEARSLHGDPPELDMIEDGPDDLTDPVGRTGDGESGRSPESPSDTCTASDPSTG